MSTKPGATAFLWGLSPPRRQTFDIDFVPASNEANDDRLASALREIGARLRVAGLTDEEARQFVAAPGTMCHPIRGRRRLEVREQLPTVAGLAIESMMMRLPASYAHGPARFNVRMQIADPWDDTADPTK